jgi:hypothetical protein
VPDRPPNDSTPTPNDVETLRERAELAERERDALRCEYARLQREHERLRRANEGLRRELDAARRAGKRQTAPFSKNRPVAHPRRPGRKPGTAYGPRARRAAPTVIDEQYDAPLPPTCPACAGPVIETDAATQYQEDLPPVRPIVRAFHIHGIHGPGISCKPPMRSARRRPTGASRGREHDIPACVCLSGR